MRKLDRDVRQLDRLTVVEPIIGGGQMKFRTSLLVDAFRGSGVPLAGDPITSFQNVPLLELRTATILNNRYPQVRHVVRVRLIATNCGKREIEIRSPASAPENRVTNAQENDSIALRPGESLDHSVFRSWDAAGEHQLTLAYQARWAGQPFARLAYPAVAVRVRPPDADKLMHWILSVRAACQRTLFHYYGLLG